MSQTSLLFRMVVSGAVVLVTMAVVLPLGWMIWGNPPGIFPGIAAGGICLLATWISLGLSEPFRKQGLVVPMVLVATAVRLAIPLGTAVVVVFRGGPLSNAGFLIYLIVFYLVTLAVETAFTLPQGPKSALRTATEQKRAD